MEDREREARDPTCPPSDARAPGHGSSGRRRLLLRALTDSLSFQKRMSIVFPVTRGAGPRSQVALGEVGREGRRAHGVLGLQIARCRGYSGGLP